MGQEGGEEEAAADHGPGLVIDSAWSCWCMLFCEHVGYSLAKQKPGFPVPFSIRGYVPSSRICCYQ